MAETAMTRITSSGNIDGTNAIQIFSIVATATSGGATVVTVKDGGSGGNVILQLDAATSKCTTASFNGGLSCPTGGYVTVDGNTSYVTVAYKRMS